MTTVGKNNECEQRTERVECLPCDIDAFCRNHYFTGKLLTERDLSAEQRYFIDKLRLHHLALHGWGVVCGLKVKPHPHCPDLRLVVEPGLAVDGCGRQILVPGEVEIELPKRPEPPPDQERPCPPEEPRPDPRQQARQEPKPDPRQQVRQEPKPGSWREDSPVQGLEDEPGQAVWQEPEEPDEDETARQQRECPPPEMGLYLCVRYTECETEFKPAPFDECACNGDPQRPNRICEGYRLEWELLAHPPEDWERIRELRSPPDPEDCGDLYGEALGPCPEPGWPRCIPLAAVRPYEPGAEVTAERIDNRTWRPLLPSTRLLDRLVRCILDKLPTRKLTRIEDTGWTHGSEHSFADFCKLFVGDESDPQALTIRFDGPVRPEGLSADTYQAIAVFRRERRTGGGYMEVVPAKVWVSNDDPPEFSLRPDPDYVHRCLRGIDFDLYLVLRCDLILDQRGCPVDGDLLARLRSDGTREVAPPTGNGIPGGRFESRIRVFAEPWRRSS